jgi:cobalt-zinc-cadmium efflux system membrane fusion protein
MKSRLLCCFGGLALLAIGCHRAVGPAQESSSVHTEGNKVVLPDQQTNSVTVEPVQICNSSVTHLNGRLIWDEDATVRIFTSFAGRVTKIVAEVGQKVHKGDPLAEIASPEFGQAQADARKAASDFALAERNLSRLKELFSHGAAAEKDLQAAEADYERAHSEKQRTTARLALYGGIRDSIDQVYVLTSPLEGVVVERNLNPGQEVRADAQLANASQFFAPQFVVTDPRRLWVQLDATEQDLPQLKEAQPIVIHSRAYPDQPFNGRLDSIADFFDKETRTIKVRGSVQNPQRLLKAEMFVSVDLAASPSEAAGVDVSSKAVYSKGDKRYIFLEESPGRYERREVKVGPEHDGKVLLLDGVGPGQRVVIEGCLLLDQVLQASTGS